MATPASLLVECAPLHASGTGARIQFESGDTVEVLHDSESQEWLCQARAAAGEARRRAMPLAFTTRRPTLSRGFC